MTILDDVPRKHLKVLEEELSPTSADRFLALKQVASCLTDDELAEAVDRLKAVVDQLVVQPRLSDGEEIH